MERRTGVNGGMDDFMEGYVERGGVPCVVEGVVATEGRRLDGGAVELSAVESRPRAGRVRCRWPMRFKSIHGFSIIESCLALASSIKDMAAPEPGWHSKI